MVESPHLRCLPPSPGCSRASQSNLLRPTPTPTSTTTTCEHENLGVGKNYGGLRAKQARTFGLRDAGQMSRVMGNSLLMGWVSDPVPSGTSGACDSARESGQARPCFLTVLETVLGAVLETRKPVMVRWWCCGVSHIRIMFSQHGQEGQGGPGRHTGEDGEESEEGNNRRSRTTVR